MENLLQNILSAVYGLQVFSVSMFMLIIICGELYHVNCSIYNLIVVLSTIYSLNRSCCNSSIVKHKYHIQDVLSNVIRGHLLRFCFLTLTMLLISLPYTANIDKETKENTN